MHIPRLAFVLTLAACARAPRSDVSLGEVVQPVRQAPDSSSARWLNLLPDGEEKRRFILDCTGCHQLDARIARLNGRPRTRQDWEAAIRRMLEFAGPTTGFPVIGEGRDAAATATWLARHLGSEPRLVGDATAAAARDAAAEYVVHEFMMPSPTDLPHDVAVDARGRVIVTGMFSHAMHVLDPLTEQFTSEPIPVERANPRAVEIDAQGNWWVVLGAPMRLARRTPAGEWQSWDVGVYPHSLAVDPRGRVWYNGHFTRDPEIVGAIDVATGAHRVDTLPLHPRLGERAGGPIPYEIRLAPDGRVWLGELQGNRLVALDPRTGGKETVDLPLAWSGPRRFDVDARGSLWIPAYAANALVRFDPAARRFTEYPLPVRDAVPYVARVDGTVVWLGTAAADVVYRFDISTAQFTTVELPSRGAMVRHLAIDPRTHDVWVAYGASPGIPARIARISRR